MSQTIAADSTVTMSCGELGEGSHVVSSKPDLGQG